MLKMERVRELITTTLVYSLIVILLCSTLALTSPIEKRSYNLMPSEITCDMPISLGDGMLRDMMMIAADFNEDNKLSATEITWFYRALLQYTDYVSQTYGTSFIEIADLDHDGLLDSDELLCLLSAISASNWTRR